MSKIWMRTVGSACLAAAVLSLAGCIAIGGSDDVRENTKGQELIDLKRAHEKGAIDREEYEEEKEDILHGH